MSETITVGLTRQERDLLLRGLRYVRSDVMLEIRDPSPAVEQDRQKQLREIASLVEQLNGAQSANAPAGV